MKIRVKGSVIAYERKEMICLEVLNPQREVALVESVVKSEAPAPCMIPSPSFRVLGLFLCPDSAGASLN